MKSSNAFASQQVRIETLDRSGARRSWISADTSIELDTTDLERVWIDRSPAGGTSVHTPESEGLIQASTPRVGDWVRVIDTHSKAFGSIGRVRATTMLPIAEQDFTVDFGDTTNLPLRTHYLREEQLEVLPASGSKPAVTTKEE